MMNWWFAKGNRREALYKTKMVMSTDTYHEDKSRYDEHTLPTLLIWIKIDIFKPEVLSPPVSRLRTSMLETRLQSCSKNTSPIYRRNYQTS